jgi:hypothetical protein
VKIYEPKLIVIHKARARTRRAAHVCSRRALRMLALRTHASATGCCCAVTPVLRCQAAVRVQHG